MTRYPKAGKNSKWTIKELNSIPPSWRGDTLNDGEGLYGEVRANENANISVRFKYAYRWNNKVSWYQCGTYPTNSMSQIRSIRDGVKLKVKNRIDPKLSKKAELIESNQKLERIINENDEKLREKLTFRDLFDVWIKDGVNRSDNNKYIIDTFNRYALPALESIEIKLLSENDLRTLYRGIMNDKKYATAIELSKDIKQMFNWAEKRKPWRALLVDGNPCELVDTNKLLPVSYTKERDRKLSDDELIKLKSILNKLEINYKSAEKKYDTERPLKKETELALWICLATVCRIGELLMAEWSHVNLNEGIWSIPKENTKGQRGKKVEQVVYLSNNALKHFKELHTLTGDTKWLFPARYTDSHVCIKSVTKQIGDRQIKFKSRNKKLQFRVENDTLCLGDREWTPHDLRRTGSTLMQKLGEYSH